MDIHNYGVLFPLALHSMEYHKGENSLIMDIHNSNDGYP